MKMPQDQIERIAALGYTEPEARFLYVVATHSGYFTMRHFTAFTEVSRGKRSMAFAQKLLKHAHATVRDYLGTGSVFHLFSRLVYGPIDKDNVRNRRRHSFDYIRTRLVQMDFLLENPGHDFLETESDKVNLFCESLAVPKDVLPAKVYEGGPGSHTTVRYFVDKFPLFLAAPLSGRLACGHLRVRGFRHGKPMEFCRASRGLSRTLPPLEELSPALHCAAGYGVSPR